MFHPVNPLIWLIGEIVSIYSWMLGIYIILNWLIAFNIINRYQPFVNKTYYVLSSLVEPALSKIRRYIPDLGGIDISPFILIIGLHFLMHILYYYF